MPRGTVKFKQADVVRAIQAAKAAGEPGAEIKIDVDGRIKVTFGQQVRPAATAEQNEADRTINDWLKNTMTNKPILCVDSNGVINSELWFYIKALEDEVLDWQSCARYDACMNGPMFKDWDRSALDCCRRKYIEDAA